MSARGNGIHAVGGAALGNGKSAHPAAVFAEGGAGYGLHATATEGLAVLASSGSGCAVDACSAEGVGMRARCESDAGLALAIEGRIQVRGCAVGVALLPACARTVTIAAAAATPESLILLMPLGDPGEGVRIWIDGRRAHAFTIAASAAPSADLRIPYLIVN
jgi:hypothetical protein